MMNKQSINLKKFPVRLGFIAIAIVLIMYLAKVWFVEHICLYRQQTEMGKTADSIPVISWQKAANHYGEYVAVEGTVVATYNSGKACFLNFHQDYRRHFTAVIFASSFCSQRNSVSNISLFCQLLKCFFTSESSKFSCKFPISIIPST